MLRRLVEFSLEFRAVIVTLACLLLAYGSFATARAKLDVFPELALPQVTVLTEAPGFSPEEVEALVTTPVERAMNGVRDLQSLRSQSIQGFSVITATFGASTDILRARQLVAEHIAQRTAGDRSGAVRGVVEHRHSAAAAIAHRERRVVLRNAVEEIHAANVAARTGAQRKM
jgi:Cu/Ag efflux pump CusA